MTISRTASHPVVGRPLTWFFVLAYGLSWWPWALGADFLLYPFVAIGPLLAALIVIGATEGLAGYRELGSRMVRWRIRWPWYLVAVAVPIAVGSVATLIGLASGLSSPSLAGYSVSSVLAMFAIRLVVPTDGPMGEEPGWRGYALPQLQLNRAPHAAAGILGIVVAGWHLPLVLVAGDGGAVNAGGIALFGTFASTFFYCWLFNHAGGSVLLTLVAHSADGLIRPGLLGYAGDELVAWSIAYVVAWSLVAITIVLLDRDGWRPTSHPVPPSMDVE